MKKWMMAFVIFFIAFAFVGCDITTTTTTKTDATSSSSLSLTIDEEDVNQDTITSDDTVTFTVTDVSTLNELANVSGSTVTITSAGVYEITGTSDNAKIIIDASGQDVITLILNNADLTAQNGAVIEVVQADKLILTLAQDSSNVLSDTTSVDHNAVIETADDLTINGYGSLTIDANYNNAIDANDSLTIVSGNLIIEAKNNGLNVNDDLMIQSVNMSIVCGNDGIQVENLDNDTLGNLVIEGGVFSISAYGDGMYASNVIAIYSGTFTIASGVNNTNVDSVSGKGVKATNGINILGGDFTVTSKDDGFHANSDFYIQGGNLTISSSDDGIHADETLIISGGTINITKSYEGIESLNVIIQGGNISLVTSDDGINCAGGADSSSNFFDPNQITTGALLEITGGYLYINALGDGLDSNGSISMSGGTVLVSGPTSTNNGAIDFNGTFTMTGGVLVAAGSLGMAQNVSSISNQASVLINLTSAVTSSLTLKNTSGDLIVYFQPAKTYQTIVISSPMIQNGGSYSLYLGCSASGNVDTHNYSASATISGGSLYQTFTLTSAIYSLGSSGTFPRR